ncbi:MAG: 1-(5-phosphoribosyl)-5-[(5-phosphoribosylamino)methylideneamino]imidazole-4-carboxamide isomerase [Planctomycetia bacterium]|nr:1-(5-phosphoribosyl)-5-[(5-phosphoribosylamino)methylideneamino]imidazole-4-carboxamide isomerase [Planctomycetia bacterium]
MEIWPAIDIRGGQCVRLRQGDYNQETVYGTSPAEMAVHWFHAGAKRLHLVDLDGAKDGKLSNLAPITDLVREVDIPCELGGGIRNEESIKTLLDAGLARLVVGTLALKNPDWFCEMAQKYPHRLVLGIDARNGFVATDGWLETSSTSAIELARQFEGAPLAALVYTDIATDGMMKGPNLEEMKKMNEQIAIPLVASGGITTIQDVKNLYEAGIPACIIGRALYERTILLKEALEYERS